MTTIYPLVPYLILLATCAPGFHQTYSFSRPWSAPPGEPPLVMQIHTHSGHRPLILVEPPRFTRFGFTRFAITACSHKVHSWGAAVRGRWPSSKVTNWCSLCPCRSHTSTMMKARGCAPSNSATRGDTPLCTPPRVRISAGGAPKTRGFLPQNLLYVSGDFHTFRPFSGSCCFSSKWNRLWRKNASLALNG